MCLECWKLSKGHHRLNLLRLATAAGVYVAILTFTPEFGVFWLDLPTRMLLPVVGGAVVLMSRQVFYWHCNHCDSKAVVLDSPRGHAVFRQAVAAVSEHTDVLFDRQDIDDVIAEAQLLIESLEKEEEREAAQLSAGSEAGSGDVKD